MSDGGNHQIQNVLEDTRDRYCTSAVASSDKERRSKWEFEFAYYGKLIEKFPLLLFHDQSPFSQKRRKSSYYPSLRQRSSATKARRHLSTCHPHLPATPNDSIKLNLARPPYTPAL
mmetsp:Transcript_7548/g.13955  ORF Transcript_7548/g.13955 Transcript_7548/m.13955 type:complete len:116 (-) Transcript_7548:467-814(-)